MAVRPIDVTAFLLANTHTLPACMRLQGLAGHPSLASLQLFSNFISLQGAEVLARTLAAGVVRVRWWPAQPASRNCMKSCKRAKHQAHNICHALLSEPTGIRGRPLLLLLLLLLQGRW